MVYHNKAYLSMLKQVQLISGVAILLAISVTIWLEQYRIVVILGIFLLLMTLLARLLNFNFVRVQIENGKLIIRHYALYSVDRDYESIEFPIASLRHAKVKKYFFGLKWDLHLTVKLKQGLASYPPVCLSAVPFSDRKKIVNAISELLIR
jgi:hypothetical protein